MLFHCHQRMQTLTRISLLFILCYVTTSSQIPRCLLNREDLVPCQFRNPRLMRAGVNEYSVHSTRFASGGAGSIECRVRPRGQYIRPISILGDTEDIKFIYSPGFILGRRYPNQIRAEYNIQCAEDKVIFYNITHLDLQGEEDCFDINGIPRCQDYILIDRGAGVTSEICGNISSNNDTDLSSILESNRFSMLFVCLPAERALNECQGTSDIFSCICQYTHLEEILNTTTIQGRVNGSRACLVDGTLQCIPDMDKDCVEDEEDNCRYKVNSDQRDTDGDGVGDVCDNCVFTANKEQENSDGDRAGRACDADDSNPRVVTVLGLNNVSVSEDIEVVSVCVTVDKPQIDCPIDYPFDITFSTVDDEAVSPDDFMAFEVTRKFPVCNSSLCVNISINDDKTLENDEVFKVMVTVEDEEPVSVNQSNVSVMIKDNKKGNASVRLQKKFIEVFENVDTDNGVLCAEIDTDSTDIECLIQFDFEVIILLNSSTEAATSDDLTTSSVIVSFTSCETQSCAALPIINDDIIEGNKSFYYMLERTADLDERIKLNSTVKGKLVILNDDDVMSVGFNSTTFTGTETVGHAVVCVEVLNPPSGGAIQPFSLTILPGEGKEISSQQFTLECSRELQFEKGSSVQCHEYNITQDNVCELKESATHFQLRLSVTDTDLLSIDNGKSTATVSIDDSSEPECDVRVWHEHSSYTISNVMDYAEICVISYTPGTQENFTINITTNHSNSSPIQQNYNSLEFLVNNTHPKEIGCYNISVDFDDNKICEHFNCSSNIKILSTLESAEDTSHVNVNASKTTVSIEAPEKCECTSLSSQSGPVSSNVIIAAVVPSLIIVIAIMAIVMVTIILFYYIKTRNNKQVELEERSEDVTDGTVQHYDSLDEVKTSVLSSQLTEQLKEKRMLFSKNQLELSKTVGQGESGLVYKGYLNTAIGKELVAVKTGKALYSKRDKDRLAKEVSTMLSFEHTNVMSLIGVCLDGDTPLLIMPFMTNGNVLEFVKHHRDELLCINKREAEVQYARKRLLTICHQISNGMEYLALQKFVHRDLAARNCMIDRDGVIRVADFGLTEDMYRTNYFRRRQSVTGNDEKVPIRWMAPESIAENIYTEATDVWSFGVTVWEIFTCGRIPYTGIPVIGLLKELQRGQRLERPDNEACQDEVYEIMQSCWSLDSYHRPQFKDLVGKLSGLLEKESGYLELSQSLCWKEDTSHLPLSSPSTALPVIEEQETIPAEDEI